MIKHMMRNTVLFCALLLVAACQGPPATLSPAPTGTPSLVPTLTSTLTHTPTTPSHTRYLTEEIPPCTPISGSSIDPCDSDAVPFEASIAQYSPELGDEPLSIREMLDSTTPPINVRHLMLRGTYAPGTVRCTSDGHLRLPSYLPNEAHDASDERSFKCYIDIRVNAYILGSGPPILTVLLFIDYYSIRTYASYTDEDRTVQGLIEEDRQSLEKLFGSLIPGREHIMFLGPPADLSSEAWRFMGYWDVQRRKDGTVIAVHPDRDHWRRLKPDEYQEHLNALEVAIPALKLQVTEAHQARVIEYSGRIGTDKSLPMLLMDANQLRQYYTSVGAYDHPDGPPKKPPPAPGLDDPVPNMPVDDGTPAASPTPPGGLEDTTPTPAPRDDG